MKIRMTKALLSFLKNAYKAAYKERHNPYEMERVIIAKTFPKENRCELCYTDNYVIAIKSFEDVQMEDNEADFYKIGIEMILSLIKLVSLNSKIHFSECFDKNNVRMTSMNYDECSSFLISHSGFPFNHWKVCENTISKIESNEKGTAVFDVKKLLSETSHLGASFASRFSFIEYDEKSTLQCGGKTISLESIISGNPSGIDAYSLSYISKFAPIGTTKAIVTKGENGFGKVVFTDENNAYSEHDKFLIPIKK